jgi:hypothetical protein
VIRIYRGFSLHVWFGHVVLAFVYFCFSFGGYAKEWIWVTGLENVFVKKYEELMCYVFPLRGGHRFNIFVSSKFSFLGLLRTHAFDIRVGLEEDLWNGMSYWVF